MTMTDKKQTELNSAPEKKINKNREPHSNKNKTK